MKRIGIIGLCFAAVLAFSAVVVTSASATEVLFSSATGTFEATGGKAELNAASKVECAFTKSIGTIETAHLGTLEIHFETCTTQILGSHPCLTGPPAKSGEIRVKVPFHIGLGRKTSIETAHAALLILANPTIEFTCANIGTVKVNGSLVALLKSKAGGALESPAELLGSVIALEATGKTQSHKEFLLSLAENQLMTKMEMEAEVFGTKGESAMAASAEITGISPTGAHLVTG